MLGVVVPAHNEEARIAACLHSLKRAAAFPGLRGEPVEIVVALDACDDATAAVVLEHDVSVVVVNARNVGIARACGAEVALAVGARWLAFTDADTVVAPDWLYAQLALGSDAVCGTVEVGDWGEGDAALRQHHSETYFDVDGHRHIHGANMGVSAGSYISVGGFQPLCSSEDVALVQALQVHGSSIAWSASPRVVTSARRHYRAPGGFGQTLATLQEQLASVPTAQEHP
jgi:glycosyltransferase involved in cell wall biosynthesis